jgi:hypothetical protein
MEDFPGKSLDKIKPVFIIIDLIPCVRYKYWAFRETIFCFWSSAFYENHVGFYGT